MPQLVNFSGVLSDCQSQAADGRRSACRDGSADNAATWTATGLRLCGVLVERLSKRT